jgi:hypothetical protein
LDSPKSLVSLMVVSVLMALPSLWYCLILVFLQFTCRDGVTPSVMTRVRNFPGVARRPLLARRRAKTRLIWAGPADVEIAAQHLLEEDPPGHRGVGHLGQGEIFCRAGTSPQAANPLSSGSKLIPAWAACRLAHSLPLMHSLASPTPLIGCLTSRLWRYRQAPRIAIMLAGGVIPR